ncbi:MAG: ABC transporter permease, partial [Muribaculaceae bacterium]|nr:ABC transporter permease [Muribaculaceae bacterium]
MTSVITASVKREILHLSSRRIYIVAMIVIPVFAALFFLSILNQGLPVRVPVAVIDLDDSSMSRSMTRSLSALETVDVTVKAFNFDEALSKLQQGEIFGVFYIPENFEKEAIGGRTPMLSYYTNLTYYVPGSLAFKGFKTIAVSTSGSIVRTTLVSEGV